MRRFLIVLAIAVVAFAAYWAITTTDSSILLGDSTPPTVHELDLPADAQRAEVTHVHDGDTLFIQPEGTTAREDELKVRLVGIDTPEVQPAVECFGAESRDALRQLLPDGSTVWFSFDVEPYDQYDRALLYLWNTDGTFINLELIEQGYAEAVRIGANDRYWPELKAAEDRASSEFLGRWGQC
ncbi:MAG TPA: thermonuclease family protein [Terrimesophilobacter sp.]|nr:thermonuclease family protein [Terrimesophilobacter sp.]